MGQVLPLNQPQFLPVGRPRRVPRQDWASFQDHLAEEWAPGEHLSVIAPTGRGGKTFLITRGLLPLWSDYRVLFIDIKDRDLTLMPQRGRPFFKHNVSRMPSRLQVDMSSTPKWFRLHVKSGLAGSSLRDQQRIVHDAMARCFKQRDWLIIGDELSFLANDLKLMAPLRDIWKRGRSNVTFIAATQSPRWVPAEMFDQPRFLMLGRLGAEGNKRLGEIGGTVDYKVVRSALGKVQRHEFLFLDRLDEQPEESMVITKVR
jgi:hypothetical protein